MNTAVSRTSLGEEHQNLAKLFFMEPTNDWEEIFVGICSVVQRDNGEWSLLMDGVDKMVGKMLPMAINEMTTYEAVDEMLLLWKENQYSYSLSFLRSEDRDSVLRLVQQAQKAIAEHRRSGEELEEVPLELPAVSVDKIHEIYLVLSNADVFQKDAFRVLLCQNNYSYLHDLLNVFPLLESQDLHTNLNELYTICRLILDLGYEDLVGELFTNDNFDKFLGIMEYKPELPNKAEYRQFFHTTVHYCNTLPCFSDQQETQIHKLYRLIFFRDAVDPQPINDIIPTALGMQIIELEHEIMKSICNQSKTIDFIYSWLKGNAEQRKVSLGILMELLLYSKDFGLEEREMVIEKIEGSNHKLSNCISAVLKESELEEYEMTQLFSILDNRITFHPESFRQFVLEGKSDLFDYMIRKLIDDSAYGLQLASYNMLHTLLITDENSRNYTPFIQSFYENYLPTTLSAVTTKKPAAAIVLRLLAEFEEKHGTNAQFFLLKNNVIPPILQLLESPDRTLQLASIQFISNCLASSQMWYRRFFIKRNYLKPVVMFGEEHASEDSLVMSAFFNLLRICANTTNNDLHEHIQMQLADCKQLLALPIMDSILPVRKRKGEEGDVLSKLLRIDS